MKQLSALILLISILTFTSCGTDEAVIEEFSYEISIVQPNTDEVSVGDSMHIHVNFDEVDGKTVHHINVTIKSASDGTVIYSKPDEEHVHSEGGHYEHHDDFLLNVDSNTDWILEAKVWGHEDGIAEVIKNIQFHVM